MRNGPLPNLPSEGNQPTKKSVAQEQSVATRHCVANRTSVADACRKIGIAEQTFYRCKRKVAGLGVAEARRRKPLEDENKRLKALVAALASGKQRLPAGLAKKR